MKLLFLAKHGPSDNSDEDAVTFALRNLGHDVVCVQEKRWKRGGAVLELIDADLCLCFKHPVISEIIDLAKRMPVAYWHFDMMESIDGDPTLERRSQSRVQWAQDILPHVVAGFHSDGDFVQRAAFRSDGIGMHSGKLVFLPQGADERTLGFGEPRVPNVAPIVFAGMVNHGQRRADHVARLQRRYGDKFQVLGDGGPRRRVHGRDLAALLASTKVFVAPDGPSTPLYASNRIFLTLGLGGFLVHPYCEFLLPYYDEAQVAYYRDRDECEALIDRALVDDEWREGMRRKGYERTVERNLYRHRCEELMRVVKERM